MNNKNINKNHKQYCVDKIKPSASFDFKRPYSWGILLYQQNFTSNKIQNIIKMSQYVIICLP